MPAGTHVLARSTRLPAPDRSCGVNTTFMHKTPEEMAERWNNGIGLTRCGVPFKQMPGQMMALEVTVDA